MAKSKTHTVLMTLSFDKEVSTTQAVATAADYIHGSFFIHGEAELMKVKKITRQAQTKPVKNFNVQPICP